MIKLCIEVTKHKPYIDHSCTSKHGHRQKNASYHHLCRFRRTTDKNCYIDVSVGTTFIKNFNTVIKYSLLDIDDLVQDYSISIANALGILQSCTKQSIYNGTLAAVCPNSNQFSIRIRNVHVVYWETSLTNYSGGGPVLCLYCWVIICWTERVVRWVSSYWSIMACQRNTYIPSDPCTYRSCLELWIGVN